MEVDESEEVHLKLPSHPPPLLQSNDSFSVLLSFCMVCTCPTAPSFQSSLRFLLLAASSLTSKP
eukprot:751404-Hanusia_phi.AAC.2